MSIAHETRRVLLLFPLFCYMMLFAFAFGSLSSQTQYLFLRQVVLPASLPGASFGSSPLPCNPSRLFPHFPSCQLCMKVQCFFPSRPSQSDSFSARLQI